MMNIYNNTSQKKISIKSSKAFRISAYPTNGNTIAQSTGNTRQVVGSLGTDCTCYCSTPPPLNITVVKERYHSTVIERCLALAPAIMLLQEVGL